MGAACSYDGNTYPYSMVWYVFPSYDKIIRICGILEYSTYPHYSTNEYFSWDISNTFNEVLVFIGWRTWHRLRFPYIS